MKNKITGIIICMLLISTMIPFSVASNETVGKTITVDDDGEADYTKIQDAIDAASDGDTIYVYNGTYYEHVKIHTSVVLQGENKDNTIIDGGEADNVVTISNDDVIIMGFTIRYSSSLRSGMYLNQYVTHITISDNIISDNNHAIYAPYPNTDNLIISNNKIISNKYGITSYATPTIISNNEIHQDTKQTCIELTGINNSKITENVLTSYKNGIVIYEGDNNVISYNNITLNGDRPGKGIHLRLLGDNNTITYNIISGTTTKSGRGITLEMGEEPSGEIQGQVISFNTISDLWSGVIIQYSPDNPRIWRNEVINNNFIGILRPAHFQNALGNKWYGNYWGNPRLVPHRISGILQFNNMIHPISWFQVDLHPRLLPNNI